MPWRRAGFKGQKVWVEVDAAGRPAVSGGRVAIRYSDAPGAKVYRAGAAGVGAVEGEALALADGVSADASPSAPKASRGSGFGSAGTRTVAQAEAAARQAESIVAEQPPGTVLAFADGACKGNPGPAGSGALVVLPDGRRGASCEALGRATNNVAELTAIDLVLDMLEEAGVPASTRVALLTDSKYAIGVLSQGWKAKANAELIADLKLRLRERPALRMFWVAGHAGVEGNEAADGLANRGVVGVSETRWTDPPEGR